MRFSLLLAGFPLFFAVFCDSSAYSEIKQPETQYGAGNVYSPVGWTQPSNGARKAAQSIGNPLHCETLHRIRELQGELYLGHILEKKLVQENCPVESTRFSSVYWNWPWRGGRVQTELPPYLHGQYGDWEIRCGLVERDRRCIVLNRTILGERNNLEIVTHFVFHHPGNKSELIWRVWAPKLEDHWYSGRTDEDNRRLEAWSNGCQEKDWKPNTCRLEDRFQYFSSLKTERIIFGLNGKTDSLRFNVCQEEGCMVESNEAIAEEAALALSRNLVVALDVSPTANEKFRVQISTAGFREAMTEFDRLWQEDKPQVTGEVTGKN